MTLGKASQHEVSSGWNSYLFLERHGDQCLEKVICHPSSVGHPPPPPFPITGKTVVGICGKRGVQYHNSSSKACEQTGRLLWDYLLLFFPPMVKRSSILQWLIQSQFVSLSKAVSCDWDSLTLPTDTTLPGSTYISSKMRHQRMSFRKQKL